MCFYKLGSCPPAGEEDRGHLYRRLPFKEMAPRAMRKTFLGCKTGERLEEDLHLKGAETEFAVASF